MAAMASLAAVAATATLASPSTVSFSGLRPLRFPSVAVCPRLAVVSRRARTLPRIHASTQESTFATIQDIISEQLAVDKNTITPESKFTDLGADSLDTVEIMMALEEKFDIQLEENNADKIITVGNAADLIESFIAAK